MTFGDKLSALRREQNYTQEQLAELLGVSRQSVSKWESGAAYPETEKLIRLSALFDCSLDYLLRDAPRGPAAPQAAELSPHGVHFTVSVPYPCYERKSARQLFGMPLYHVNIGPGRVAKGFFRRGADRARRRLGRPDLDRLCFRRPHLRRPACVRFDAIGLLAIGCVAIGILAFGAVALGLLAAGGAACGFMQSAPQQPAVSQPSAAVLPGRSPSAPRNRSAARSFRKLGALSPQERRQVFRLLADTAPFWLWAAALFALFGSGAQQLPAFPPLSDKTEGHPQTGGMSLSSCFYTICRLTAQYPAFREPLDVLLSPRCSRSPRSCARASCTRGRRASSCTSDTSQSSAPRPGRHFVEVHGQLAAERDVLRVAAADLRAELVEPFLNDSLFR